MKFTITEKLLNECNSKIAGDSFIDQAENHIAKHLYLSLDLKALEDIVFIPFNKKSHKIDDVYKVYTSAKGKQKDNYIFADGTNYRSMQIKKCIGKIDAGFLRNKEKDHEILPVKLAELFVIAMIDFHIFKNIFNVNLLSILDKLINIAALDYQMNDVEKIDFTSKVKNIYSSFMLNYDDQTSPDILDPIITLVEETKIDDKVIEDYINSELICSLLIFCQSSFNEIEKENQGLNTEHFSEHYSHDEILNLIGMIQ